MAVPYTFGNATTSIPLSQLDSNFATAITIGNTAVYLGNTTTSFGNVTLNNVTIASGNATVTKITAPTHDAGSGNALTLQSNSTTGLYIDTSQNVGIGTTSPSSYGKLTVQGTSGSSQFWGGSTAGNGVFIDAYDSATIYMLAAAANSTTFAFGSQSNIPTAFFTNNTERMRIDSSGNLLVGTTTHIGTAYITTLAAGISIGASATAGNYRQIYWDAPSSNFYFYNGTNQGYLNSAGSWTNASDARLKNSIVDIKYGLEDVIKLQPRSYRMNDLEGNYIGFVAQELQQVIPEVVSGDPEKQLGVDYGSLTALLTKAIQELSAKVTALEAKVGA